MSSFTREINRLLLGLLAAFALIILAASYYAFVGRFTLLNRDDNPRQVETQRSILRGSIYDRHGTLLVHTQPDNNQFARRVSLYPAMTSAIGYYSYRYGTAGVETTYNDVLSGVGLPTTAGELILNQPRRGSDIQLTFDLKIQQALVDAMEGRSGAAIVMAIPSGDLLALVSLPNYDPNTLDSDWAELVQSPGEPFFNRALQGRYQPGTLIHLPMMITALVEGQPLTVKFPNGAYPVTLDDLTLTCIVPPPQSEMTMREAYLYGCPAPFIQIAPSLSISAIQNSFYTLQLADSPIIDGFTDIDTNITSPPILLNRNNLNENVLGQGDLNITPIGVNSLSAAIIHDGNAPQPRVLSATRPPGETTWQDVQTYSATNAYMTTSNARRISEIMRAAALSGTAIADWRNLDVGGQAAVAYTGESAVTWFTGFAVLENQQNIVITVVLEDTDSTQEVIEVAQSAIFAAAAPAPNTTTP